MTHADFWQRAFLAALPALLARNEPWEDDVYAASCVADSALDEFALRFECGEAPVLTARHMGKAKFRFSKGE